MAVKDIMEDNKKKNSKLSIKDIALMGVMLATIEGANLAMSYLPNIELVTLLIILYALFFGRKIYYVMVGFILIEGCIYGFGIWWFMYIYIWPILAILTNLFRKQTSVMFWSIFSGVYGLCYGALCAIVYIFISGPKGAIAWWVAGIPFDIIHCVSNFVLCLVLFVPLRKAMVLLKRRMYQS